jgi:hypothetical protein
VLVNVFVNMTPAAIFCPLPYTLHLSYKLSANGVNSEVPSTTDAETVSPHQVRGWETNPDCWEPGSLVAVLAQGTAETVGFDPLRCWARCERVVAGNSISQVSLTLALGIAACALLLSRLIAQASLGSEPQSPKEKESILLVDSHLVLATSVAATARVTCLSLLPFCGAPGSWI